MEITKEMRECKECATQKSGIIKKEEKRPSESEKMGFIFEKETSDTGYKFPQPTMFEFRLLSKPKQKKRGKKALSAFIVKRKEWRTFEWR